MEPTDITDTLRSILNEVNKLDRFTNGKSYGESIPKIKELGFDISLALLSIRTAIQQLPYSFRNKHNNIWWDYYVFLCESELLFDPTGKNLLFMRVIQSMIKQNTNHIEGDTALNRCIWHIITQEMPRFQREVAALLEQIDGTPQ
jgi:uncharacterized protein with HEPN domain